MATHWTRDTFGVCYLFHFHRPLGNLANARAQALHYVGFAEDFERRLATQLAGKGAKLVAAALAQGIGYDLFHWPAALAVEKLIKKAKKTALFCPACCHAAGRPVRPLPTPATQLALPLDFDDFDFPAATAGRMDWYEIAQLRRWRATAATLIAPADLARLDECL